MYCYELSLSLPYTSLPARLPNLSPNYRLQPYRNNDVEDHLARNFAGRHPVTLSFNAMLDDSLHDC